MGSVFAEYTFSGSTVAAVSGFLFHPARTAVQRRFRMAQSFIIGHRESTNRPARLVLLGRALVMPDNEAVISRLDRDLGRGIRRVVHHARRPSFFFPRRIDEETRWGVDATTPPDRPDGRAVGSRNSLRGF
jgi:hypothetical protein